MQNQFGQVEDGCLDEALRKEYANLQFVHNNDILGGMVGPTDEGMSILSLLKF